MADDRQREARERRAVALVEKSNDLARSGQADAALEAIGMAVAEFESLGRSRLAGHIEGLAVALHNFANRLADVGRRDEALAAMARSVELHRELARNQPALRLPGLASALSNQAKHLRTGGDVQRALASSREALDLRRTLAAANVAGELEVAEELIDYAIHLRDVGEAAEALAHVTEALYVLSVMVQRVDARAALVIALAHETRSALLIEKGQAHEATDEARKAVAAHRALLSRGATVERCGLATALANLSTALAASGPNQRTAAASAATECVAVFRAAVEGGERVGAEFAVALIAQAERLGDVGWWCEASRAAEEAGRVLRPIVDEIRPECVGRLAVALNRVAEHHGANGNADLAAAASHEALTWTAAMLEQSAGSQEAPASQIVDAYRRHCATAARPPDRDLVATVERLAAITPAGHASGGET